MIINMDFNYIKEKKRPASDPVKKHHIKPKQKQDVLILKKLDWKSWIP